MMTKKEKYLGKAKERRNMDLPLERGRGTRFIMVLIAVMTWLTAIAGITGLGLNGAAKGWTAGLEKTATIEIPAQSNADIEAILATLNENDALKAVKKMEEKDILSLVEPWLGNNIDSDFIPLPTLIEIQLAENLPQGRKSVYSNLQTRLSTYDPAIRLDTNEDWLSGLKRFSLVLRIGAAGMVCIILLTLAISISGAMAAKFDINAGDIALLHIMGASDPYILSQFQRHAAIIAFQGGVAGLILSAVSIFGFKALIDHFALPLSQDYLNTSHIAIALSAIWGLVFSLAIYTTRKTVYKALLKMP